MKQIIILLSILFLVSSSYAQEFSKFTTEDFNRDKNYGFLNYVQISGYTGNHLGPEESIADIFKNGFYGAGFRIATQSTRRKYWQRYCDSCKCLRQKGLC